jgi:uncharacterized protein YdhG (YjbR/CyaY superfamily)
MLAAASAIRLETMDQHAPLKTVDEYISGVPQQARSMMREIRALIRSVAPAEATERISYGIPSFYYKGSLVAYGAFSKHCSFFPMGSVVLEPFKEELKSFHTSKGTLRLPLDRPLPAALLKKIIKACIARNQARPVKRATVASTKRRAVK